MTALPTTPSFRLDGRKALVTGGGRGIGLAAATALAEAGAVPLLAARTESEVAAASQALKDRGLKAGSAVLDVTDRKAVERLVDEEGPFQILVNNAGMNVQAMADFMNDGRFVEHIRKMRRIYRDRRDVLFDCLSKDCAGLLTPQPTDAGMHMLAWLKRGLDDQTAHRALLEEGIESLALSVYSANPIEHSALVLGFSGVSEQRIPKRVKRMSRILEKLVFAH